MGPYVGVALLLVILWLIIVFTKMPKASDEDEKLNLLPTLKRLVKKPNYVWGVVAQFFYVGAQIGVWSFTIRYVMLELNVLEDQAADYYLAALVLFTICRFIFTGLMKFISPGNLLFILSLVAVGCTLLVIYGSGMAGVIALVAISGCMSLMFPTIYGLAVTGLGKDTKIGGSGLIMAILGGAVLTAVQGQVSDATDDIHMAFWVPLACFLVVAFYGMLARKPKEVASSRADRQEEGVLE